MCKSAQKHHRVSTEVWNSRKPNHGLKKKIEKKGKKGRLLRWFFLESQVRDTEPRRSRLRRVAALLASLPPSWRLRAALLSLLGTTPEPVHSLTRSRGPGLTADTVRRRLHRALPAPEKRARGGRQEAAQRAAAAASNHPPAEGR